MTNLYLVALAGFLASMVDGALGMGFGPTSSSILLASGLSPAASAATVNIAKVFTGLAAGVAHWRFSNIDRKLVIRLAVPGMLGAGIGTLVLANVDATAIRPVLGVLLVLVGLRILYRFSRPLPPKSTDQAVDPQQIQSRGTEVAGFAGGMTNGMIGAWGPVVTPYLLGKGLAPRYAVGSVNTAEVAVAVVSAGSLITALGSGGLSAGVILAMLGGGVVAAPLSAYVLRFLPARVMGIAVSGLLLVTQMDGLADSADLGPWRWIGFATIAALLSLALAWPRLAKLEAPQQPAVVAA